MRLEIMFVSFENRAHDCCCGATIWETNTKTLNTLSANSLSTRPNKSGKSVTIQTVRTAVVSHMYCPFYGDTECYVLYEIVFVELRNSMSRKLYSISY